MARKKTVKQQVAEILQQAERKGVSQNYFFATTFKRYQMQMQILDELEKAINEYGPTVKKEYVKGRENLVANPAIPEYNKTATAANQTVSTLLKVLNAVIGDENNGDALDEFIK